MTVRLQDGDRGWEDVAGVTSERGQRTGQCGGSPAKQVPFLGVLSSPQAPLGSPALYPLCRLAGGASVTCPVGTGSPPGLASLAECPGVATPSGF